MRRKHHRDSSPSPGSAPVGNEFGWRVHEAIQGWTASVDVKASIVVVVETAVAGAGTRALITDDGHLHDATGLQLACAITAVTLLLLAVGCALWVVFPRLERRRTTELAREGLVYFGHLRARDPADIDAALASLTRDEERRQLALQLQVTGKVAWRKHAWLQRSVALFAFGASLLVLTFVAF